MATRALGLNQDATKRLHRKGFEWAQCVLGLEQLGVLGERTRALGVGVGHERVAYYLTMRTALTVATDLYGGWFTESWEGEADPAFLTDPDRFAPFPYRRDRLRALPADGRRLPFRTGTFDVVWSLSSIEHFGGPGAAALAMAELARVLRPGGVACVATDLVLAGEVMAENFTRDQLERDLIAPSGLDLVGPLDDLPPALDDPVILPGDLWRTPHLVIRHGDTFFTSVVLFLRKPGRVRLAARRGRTLLGRARTAGIRRIRANYLT